MAVEYRCGDVLHGFRVTRIRPVPEQSGTLYEFLHETSGMQAIWLHTEDNNKLFSIAFKTTPEDDTGVFHILEHSVLCGSKRYPVPTIDHVHHYESVVTAPTCTEGGYTT